MLGHFLCRRELHFSLTEGSAIFEPSLNKTKWNTTTF